MSEQVKLIKWGTIRGNPVYPAPTEIPEQHYCCRTCDRKKPPEKLFYAGGPPPFDNPVWSWDCQFCLHSEGHESLGLDLKTFLELVKEGEIETCSESPSSE